MTIEELNVNKEKITKANELLRLIDNLTVYLNDLSYKYRDLRMVYLDQHDNSIWISPSDLELKEQEPGYLYNDQLIQYLSSLRLHYQKMFNDL